MGGVQDDRLDLAGEEVRGHAERHARDGPAEEGAAEAERIRADAERQREVILAEAYRKAQAIKGEGDAKAAAIYAEAYGKNPEFYAFYRSMDAYKQTFRNKSDVLVLDPSSQFFKYLKNPGAGAKATQ